MIKIYPLREIQYQVNKSKDFNVVNDLDLVDEANGYVLTVRPFLIHLNDELILIDAGFGYHVEGKSALVQRIEEIGFYATAITKILISHLHKDHIGGIGKIINGKVEVYFPNAKIYIHEDEMIYAMAQQENASYKNDIVKGLQYHPQVNYLRETKGEIIPGVQFEKVGGHVPHQIVFWIADEEDIIFYGADNLPQLSYLKYDMAFKNDVDGKAGQESRRIWHKQMVDESWTVLFYHGRRTSIKKF
ncbi:MBL fold metallo-hydrolase [Faecalibacter rhinopitheci]|uniref:MBL fold metallo-hydrolase n=1 Tax=Faecalibacter rhinopitheci TaxID=2779678 RepID=A0A8J7KCM7_9FLAO|nr:MBL fold metallo-hydrolase [Faecalibacter rhinopitheci]MBF0596431.1 MBL fold metallo-hydrolase [Faecalibacter rhinopitheci]MBQ0148227.1 MBL fold metallo-hydrolase [Candidatus Onthonaster equi]